jgi:hypothetical protein
MKGRVLDQLGACRASFRISSTTSVGTGSGRKSRTECREMARREKDVEAGGTDDDVADDADDAGDSMVVSAPFVLMPC